MIALETLHLVEGVPIYQQIVQAIKHGMAGGQIADGEELPSRRVVSALLGVNPNTVQKAYRQLEEEGLIQSHTGAKSYAALPPGAADALRTQLLWEELRPLLRRLRQTGLSKEEALSLIDRLWEEETP